MAQSNRERWLIAPLVTLTLCMALGSPVAFAQTPAVKIPECKEIAATFRDDKSPELAEIAILKRVGFMFGAGSACTPRLLRKGSTLRLALPKLTPRQAKTLRKRSLLEFRLVLAEGVEAEGQAVPKNAALLRTPNDLAFLVGPVLLDGPIVRAASMDISLGFAVVNVEFTDIGATRFDQLATTNFQKRLAIVVDDVVQSAPLLQAAKFNGRIQITGSFTVAEAELLANGMDSGYPATTRLLSLK